MAGNDGSGSETCVKEGPVLTMMNKRLRALKKKYNRILQIEESKAQGKTINKEQEEVLKTKIPVATLIDEYEKLRQPLLVAVKEEVAEREKELMAAVVVNREEDEHESTPEEKQVVDDSGKETLEEVRQDMEGQTSAACNGDSEPALLKDKDQAQKPALSDNTHDTSESAVADLLRLLYFAQLFDLTPQSDPSSLVVKVHERSSCLSYDFVTEDSTSPLRESDLDAISIFGSMVTSRPPNGTLSHRDALQQCIGHAILWLQASDSTIRDDLRFSYSDLRERLNRILTSEYFAMIPELKNVSEQVAVAAATAAGQYPPQLLLRETLASAGTLESEGSAMYFAHQDPATGQQHLFQSRENVPASARTDGGSLDVSGSQLTANSVASYVPEDSIGEDISQVDGEVLSSDLPAASSEAQQDQQVVPPSEPSQNEEAEVLVEDLQQRSHVPNVSVGPRGYQGSSGGARGHNYGSGPRGRGYQNGRGRGGRGGYGNGRGQHYDQGAYYSRNQYGRGGGRSTRGGPMYNGYANGQAGRVSTNVPV